MVFQCWSVAAMKVDLATGDLVAGGRFTGKKIAVGF
jgi:hypothetical protein